MTAEPAGFLRRAAAWLIDIALLYVYMIALFMASVALDSVLPFHHLMAESYVLRHVISFTTLTLPLVLYFILMERSGRQGTFGKSWMKLRVEAAAGCRFATQMRPSDMSVDGVTFTSWRSEREMSDWAYGTGQHREALQVQRRTPMASRTSFTRFRVLREESLGPQGTQSV